MKNETQYVQLQNDLDDALEKVENAKRLLMRCLNTEALRCDTRRQLYEEVCKFCGIEAK